MAYDMPMTSVFFAAGGRTLKAVHRHAKMVEREAGLGHQPGKISNCQSETEVF